MALLNTIISGAAPYLTAADPVSCVLAQVGAQEGGRDQSVRQGFDDRGERGGQLLQELQLDRGKPTFSPGGPGDASHPGTAEDHRLAVKVSKPLAPQGRDVG